MVNPFRNIQIRIDKERTTLLICVGLSLLIWFFLKLSKEYETDKQIYLEYALPPLMEFTETPPDHLVATVEGTGGQLLKKFLSQRELSINIDLNSLPNQEIQSSELLWKIQEQTGLSVKNVNRNIIKFSIDSTATKKVPVIPDLKLVFEKDFFQTQPMRWTPDSILLAGPARELQNINQVVTEPAEIGPVSGNLSQTLNIVQRDFKNVVALPKEVNLEIFAEQYTEKSFEVPITVVNAPADYQLSPTKARVSFSVGLSKFESLRQDSFLVEADLSQAIKLGPNKNVPLNLKSYPSWVKSARVSPKVVEFVVIQ